MTHALSDTLVQTIERAIGPDTNWLVRRDLQNVCYFANIMNAEQVPVITVHAGGRVTNDPAALLCHARGSTPSEALEASFKLWKKANGQ